MIRISKLMHVQTINCNIVWSEHGCWTKYCVSNRDCGQRESISARQSHATRVGLPQQIAFFHISQKKKTTGMTSMYVSYLSRPNLNCILDAVHMNSACYLGKIQHDNEVNEGEEKNANWCGTTHRCHGAFVTKVQTILYGRPHQLRAQCLASSKLLPHPSFLSLPTLMEMQQSSPHHV